jgi:hypothetical protein
MPAAAEGWAIGEKTSRHSPHIGRFASQVSVVRGSDTIINPRCLADDKNSARTATALAFPSARTGNIIG